MNVQALIDLRARLENALAMTRQAEAYLVGGHYDQDTATRVANVLHIAGSVSAEAIAYLSSDSDTAHPDPNCH